MAQQRRGIGQPVSAQVLSPAAQPHQGLGDDIQVALGIYPPGNRQADQLQLWIDHFAAIRVGMREHHRADLDRTDAALQVQLGSQCLSGELRLRDMGQEAPGIQVDRMPAGRLDDGYAGGPDFSAR